MQERKMTVPTSQSSVTSLFHNAGSGDPSSIFGNDIIWHTSFEKNSVNSEALLVYIIGLYYIRLFQMKPLYIKEKW